MKPVELVCENVQAMSSYVPGWQPGPGEKCIKLNTNENPYPPSPKVIEALKQHLDEHLRFYPNPDSRALREEAARVYGLQPEQVLCGNGSDEVLAILMRTFIERGDTIAYFDPSYSLYPVLANAAAARQVTVDLPRSTDGLPIPEVNAKLFLLTHPNAPYGLAFPNSWIAGLLRAFDGIVVADEAYVDFAQGTALPLLADFPNLVVVRSFSKSYALAGLRIGLAMASAEIIAEMMKVRDSYNLNRLSQVAGVTALRDQEYTETQIRRIVATRERFRQRLERLEFAVIPSQTNFLFAVPPEGWSAAELYEYLFERRILVRYFKDPKLADGLRISVGTDEDMEALMTALKSRVG